MRDVAGVVCYEVWGVSCSEFSCYVMTVYFFVYHRSAKWLEAENKL